MMLHLYRALIRMLPHDVRERHGGEMLRTLQEQSLHAQHPMIVQWRAIRRFPLVLLLEWRDVIFAGSAPALPPRPKDSPMESLARILRQGTRSLARTPAFSLSVIMLLGAGVGSVSAIFAVVDHVLLRSLPYPNADRVIVMENGAHSAPSLRDFQSMQSIDLWGAASTDDASLTGVGDPQRIRSAVVNDGFFPLFGARAAIGRLLTRADSSVVNTAVLSYGTWIRLFGGDSSVVGRTIHIDNTAVTVVGVVDEHFVVPEAIATASVDVWRPMDPSAAYMNKRDYWNFSVAGRLKPGATLSQAQQEAKRIEVERAKTYPDVYTERGQVSTLPVRSLRDVTVGEYEQPLNVLLGAVTLLLLVACANVTHLFLARGVTRVREMALRRALGANTRSLVGQLLAESAMVGIAGAVVGVAIAYAGVRAFLALMPDGLPRAASIGVDMRVLLFAAGVGLITAIVFGMLPALRLARGNSGDVLRGSGRSVTGGRAAQRWRSGLVVAEVAISLVLVAQAGWLLRSFIRMSHQELGFTTAGIVAIPMSMPVPPSEARGNGAAATADWFQRMDAIRESLARTRGVKQVSYGLTMPLQWVGGGRCCWSSRPTFPGKGTADKSSSLHPVSEDFFSMLNIKVLAGRSWERSEIEQKPAPVVINQQLAIKTFGNVNDAVGQLVTLGKRDFRIIGVVANTRHYGADQPYYTSLYLPVNTMPFVPGNVTMAVQTDRTDNALAADLRAAIWQAEPNLPVPTIKSLADWSRRDSSHQRFDAMLFGTFSVVALLLVAGGLAGTLLYMVSLQRRSLGIRLALGATPGGLERGVLTNGVGLAAIGVVLGTVGSWFAGKLIESRLFGVEARDVQTLALAVTVLMAIAVISSWIPARRAAGTNPIESLRAE